MHMVLNRVSDLHHNDFCLNLTEKMSGVYLWVLGTEGSVLLDIWRVTPWIQKGPVSCRWHFDPGRWSHLTDLWPVSMPFRPYVHVDILWQAHASGHTEKGTLVPLMYHKLIYVPGHKGPNRCDHMTGGSAHRVVIIALPGRWHQRSSWQDTRRQMLRAKREHFHLCEIRVSNLIMTAGHTLDT